MRRLGGHRVTDVLGRIDNVLAGNLCPCGAAPALGSAYCGDDCTPTTSDTDGSQMRWRPDLVTATDDLPIELVDEFPHDTRRGLQAAWYRYVDRDMFHARIEDGHRFVGCDVLPEHAGPDDLPPGIRRELDSVYLRLERELGVGGGRARVATSRAAASRTCRS